MIVQNNTEPPEGRWRRFFTYLFDYWIGPICGGVALAFGFAALFFALIMCLSLLITKIAY
jgi:hypothetical protein